jgi:lysyl-tRNA synthetase class II
MAELVEERIGWYFTKLPLQALAPEDGRQVWERIRQAFGPLVARALDALRARNEAAGESLGSQAYEGMHRQFVDRAMSELEHRLRGMSPAEQLVEVYEKLIEPTLIDPCFVTHVPSVVIPLARENKDDPFFADVYELAVNGTELSPGYSELNDPAVQAKHFAHQVGAKDEQQQVDEDFLNALRYGMPPAGGLGLGIDRLAMLLTGAESIRDVILFPLLRPPAEKKHDGHDEEGK